MGYTTHSPLSKGWDDLVRRNFFLKRFGMWILSLCKASSARSLDIPMDDGFFCTYLLFNIQHHYSACPTFGISRLDEIPRWPGQSLPYENGWLHDSELCYIYVLLITRGWRWRWRWMVDGGLLGDMVGIPNTIRHKMMQG